jgi:hypothetical protein
MDMSAIKVQLNPLVLWIFIGGLVWLIPLPVIVELLIMISEEASPPPVWFRALIYGPAYIVLAFGLTLTLNALRLRQMIIEQDGIRMSPDNALISWNDIDSCYEHRRERMLRINLRNGKGMWITGGLFQNYDELRSALALGVHIEQKEA